VTDATTAAPVPSHRLIPSRFPPIGLFDTVATAADLRAVMDLAGWTNDRLVAGRLDRLPEAEWVYGRPNASVVMAAFLHVAPAGMRFNAAGLGAWYASASLTTAAAEVGHHLRREAAACDVAVFRRQYRAYSADLAGSYLDLRGQSSARPDLYAPDSYVASQALGEAIRAAGGTGIVYDSVRHAGGTNVVAHRPRNVGAVVQADHFEISVQAATPRIEVRLLAAPEKAVSLANAATRGW
jgi:RES domain-containing protein